MYVSIHATTHPIEYAGFLALERMAFAREMVEARERGLDWCTDVLTIELGVPEAIDDVDPTCFLLACG